MAKIDCPECGGTGVVGNWSCRKCNSSHEVEVCTQCDGKGYYVPSGAMSTFTCEECGGTGYKKP